MSVCVGIDVHRKRSQVAVVAEDGKVQLNRNVVNGSEPMLRLIGGLPAGTPVAFEAAYGWGWLIELLEDYGSGAAHGAPAAVQGDRLGAAEERQGPAPRSWRSCCAPTCCPRRRSPRRRSASSARCCGTGSAWSGWAPSCATGSKLCRPRTEAEGKLVTESDLSLRAPAQVAAVSQVLFGVSPMYLHWP